MNYFILAYIFEEQRYNYLLNVNYDSEHQIFFYVIFFPPQPHTPHKSSDTHTPDSPVYYIYT